MPEIDETKSREVVTLSLSAGDGKTGFYGRVSRDVAYDCMNRVVTGRQIIIEHDGQTKFFKPGVLKSGYIA